MSSLFMYFYGKKNTPLFKGRRRLTEYVGPKKNYLVLHRGFCQRHFYIIVIKDHVQLVAQQMLGYPRLQIEVKNRPRFYFFQHENLFARNWQYGQQTIATRKQHLLCDKLREIKIERFRITLTANGRNFHVIMFIPLLPFFFFQFFSKID